MLLPDCHLPTQLCMLLPDCHLPTQILSGNSHTNQQAAASWLCLTATPRLQAQPLAWLVFPGAHLLCCAGR
jgi:hypothetical protein